MNTKLYKFSRDVTQNEILKTIDRLNDDTSCHGIIVQLPFDTDNRIDSNLVINWVNPYKDVDGLTNENAGKLSNGILNNVFIPCNEDSQWGEGGG